MDRHADGVFFSKSSCRPSRVVLVHACSKDRIARALSVGALNFASFFVKLKERIS